MVEVGLKMNRSEISCTLLVGYEDTREAEKLLFYNYGWGCLLYDNEDGGPDRINKTKK